MLLLLPSARANSIRPGTSITVDGVRTEGEWDDAGVIDLLAGERRYQVFYKRDTHNLLFAFGGFTGDPVRVPEVLIDVGNQKSAGWEANNIENFDAPPALMEMRIPEALLGLEASGDVTIGIAFNVTDTSNVWEFWPRTATLSSPVTWGSAIIKR